MITIEELATQLAAAKHVEDAARAERLRIEEVICTQVAAKPEGSTSVDAGAWKVTITTSVRRTLNEAKLREIAHQIPDDIGAKVIRWKPDVVLSELRSVQKYRPDVYAALSIAITAKPGKPAVKIARTEQEAA